MRLCRLILATVMLAVSAGPASAGLIFYYNFNSFDTSATSIDADFGDSFVDLSDWGGTVASFGGTTTNALFGDAAGDSLSLRPGSGLVGNGDSIDFIGDLTGFIDPVLTFATQGSGTGFTSGVWSYSVDGSTFTSVSGNTARTIDSFVLRTVDFSGISALSNANFAVFRYTLDGASGASGNNRIDNVQLNATAIPEPTTLLLVACGGAGGCWIRRKRGTRKADSSAGCVVG